MTEEKEKHTRSTLLGFFSPTSPCSSLDTRTFAISYLEPFRLRFWSILVHFSKVLFWIDV